MKKLIQTAMLSAVLIAVFSVPISFVSNAYAGGGPSDLELILLADCAFVHGLGPTTVLPSVTPGNDSVIGFIMQNDGTATATVEADIGNIATGGGFQDDGDLNLSIFPHDVDIDATNTPIDSTALAALQDDGTPTLFAILDPFGTPNDPTPRTTNIFVHTDNIQNLPKVGTQSATLTFTVSCA